MVGGGAFGEEMKRSPPVVVVRKGVLGIGGGEHSGEAPYPYPEFGV